MVIMVSCQTRAPLPRIPDPGSNIKIRKRISTNLKIKKEKNARIKDTKPTVFCLLWWGHCQVKRLNKMTFGWHEDEIWMRVAFSLKLPSPTLSISLPMGSDKAFARKKPTRWIFVNMVHGTSAALKEALDTFRSTINPTCNNPLKAHLTI